MFINSVLDEGIFLPKNEGVSFMKVAFDFKTVLLFMILAVFYGFGIYGSSTRN